ncbi:MAG: tRNA (N(6)-L-threonylcarbamoyladenosine(37)-C(2))-methylthiotransferase MtaB [Thermodesulfovibrionales bacterium]|nr:tRNA (N(6)-L-threonylcarbamoyladenosine(37)-C(2))-methylthiotransferase MtaB [Thermodesulfovibrionales bacterium]
MKFAILTLGCKTNQAESNYIEKALFELGHEIVDKDLERPEICIINTCAVTAKAEQQSRQLIQRYLKKNVKVIVTGCYSQYYPEKVKAIDSNIIILNNEHKDDVSKIIIPTFSKNFKASERTYIPKRHRPTVKIQDGCNNSCTYCIVPLIRGSARSVPPHKIVREIISYENSGFKEVVLTGIHIGSYGCDLNPPLSISKLLKLILEKTKVIRLRLSSLEVNEVNDELLETMSSDRICKHLHIPLQSGDDKILKNMNRQYTMKEYIKKIQKILYLFGEIGLGTDVIVGFPGEDDKAFRNTEDLIKNIPFTYIHVFSFSPRPGTKAATLPMQVDENSKKERSKKLKILGQEKKRLYIYKNIGKIKNVIVESESEEGFNGTTEDYIKVLIPKNQGVKEGIIFKIMIEKYYKGLAIGKSLNTIQKY